MRPFSYLTCASVDEAVAAATADPDTSYLAGGTNLVDLMRLGVARPATLIDVAPLLSRSVEVNADQGLMIGAGVLNSELAADPRVRRDYPSLSEALLAGASGQLRNMATVGGNLLQRTRCLYFQDVTKPCNKRLPESGCPARTGVHRDLAILGASEHCIATHPSDMAVALAALDATVHVRGAGGARALPLDEFYRLPGDDPSRDTSLRPGDLIVAVELPPPSRLTRCSGYRKVRDRASYAFAVASVAAALEVDNGVIVDARIALGAVAHRPWRARAAEAELRGSALTRSSVLAAMAREMQAAHPLPGNAFKVELSARAAVELILRLSEDDGPGAS